MLRSPLGVRLRPMATGLLLPRRGRFVIIEVDFQMPRLAERPLRIHLILLLGILPLQAFERTTQMLR